jgi:hypothetical protein
MAKQRWATFSVEDHKNVSELIPDILSFDKLVFPYPRDKSEWDYWKSKGWEPKPLDDRLKELGDLAIPFEWGENERALYRTRLPATQDQFNLDIAMAAYASNEAQDKIRWEIAKQATRDTIGDRIRRQYGDDCWLLPRYGSLAALQAARALSIRFSERERRRTRLTVLLGHELALPSHAKAQTAYTLAIELAKDKDFQRARRELNTKQELMVLQEQSGKNDAEEFADLVSAFNARVEARTKVTRRGWLFTLLKIAHELAEIIEKPFSSIFGAALEVTETATQEEDLPAGPIAVFHHTKKRVFDPARA